MVPIGSKHAYALNKLNRLFSKSAPENILVRIQDPLRLNEYNEPETDLALVTFQDYSKRHPYPADAILVIEVADSSLGMTWILKCLSTHATVYRKYG